MEMETAMEMCDCVIGDGDGDISVRLNDCDG